MFILSHFVTFPPADNPCHRMPDTEAAASTLQRLHPQLGSQLQHTSHHLRAYQMQHMQEC